MERQPAIEYREELLGKLKNLSYCGKYLSAALRDSTETFLVALRNVAEAQKGMTALAVAAGVNRENLYRMLSEDGNPRLNSLESVLQTLGLRLSIIPIESKSEHADKEPHSASKIGLVSGNVGRPTKSKSGSASKDDANASEDRFLSGSIMPVHSLTIDIPVRKGPMREIGNFATTGHLRQEPAQVGGRN